MGIFNSGIFNNAIFNTGAVEPDVEVVIPHGGTGGNGRFKRRKRSYWGDPEEAIPDVEPVTAMTRVPFSSHGEKVRQIDELRRLVHLEYEASKRRKRNRMVALAVVLLDE